MLSLLLEEDGKTKRPFLGMYLGKGDYEELGINHWVRIMCLFDMKSCKTVRNKSCKDYKVWVCTDAKCRWSLKVNQSSKNRWTVTRFDGVHDEYCTSTAVENGPSYRVLAKLLQATTGKLATSAEVRAHLEKIGVRGAGQISDAQMQRVKRCHEEMHLESFHKSFSFVQSKLGTLVDRNPVDLQTIQLEDSNGEKSERFYRMYFILKSDIDVALHCKPVLSFDAGALKLSQWSRYQVMQRQRRSDHLDYFSERSEQQQITNEAKVLMDDSVRDAQHLRLSAPMKTRAEDKTLYEVSHLRGFAPSASGMEGVRCEDRQTVIVVGNKGSDVSITCTSEMPSYTTHTKTRHR